MVTQPIQSQKNPNTTMNHSKIPLLVILTTGFPLLASPASALQEPGPACCTKSTCDFTYTPPLIKPPGSTGKINQSYAAPTAFPATAVLKINMFNLALVGTGNFTASGNNLNNAITGSAGNDKIDDGLGSDTIFIGTDNVITSSSSGTVNITKTGTTGQSDTVTLTGDSTTDTVYISTTYQSTPPAPFLGSSSYISASTTCTSANRISRRGFTAENLAESLPSRLELLAQNSTTTNGDYRAGVVNQRTSMQETQPITVPPTFALIPGVASVLTPDLGGKSGDQIVAAGSDFGFSDDQIRKYQKGRPPIQVTNSKETASLKLGSDQPSVVYFTDNGWLTALTRKADGEIAGKVIVRLLDLKGNPVRLPLTASGTAGNDFLRIVPAAKQGRVVAGLW